MTPKENEVLTDYSEDGVDLTLIRWMLSLTPRERLNFAERFVNRVLSIREFNAENDFFAPLRALQSYTPQQ